MRRMLTVLIVILVLSACSAHVSGALPPLGAPVLVSGTTAIQVDSFPFDGDDRVSFEEQVRLLSWASELYAELPAREFVASNSELEKWAATLLPLFVEAGSVAEAQVPTIMFGDLTSKNTVGEVLGETSCDGNVIYLHADFADLSSNSPEWILILAHELAHHMYRLCQQYDPSYYGTLNHAPPLRIEATTDIRMLEGLATLVRSGDAEALYAFLYGIERAAYYNILASTVEGGQVDEYSNNIERYIFDPSLRSQANKDMDLIRGNPWAAVSFQPIMVMHGRLVVEEWQRAHNNNSQTNQTLKFYPAQGLLASGRFNIDNTLYVLEHLDEYVRNAQ